jgi:hypothetical protein
MDNSALVFDNRFYEILLDWLHISELCTFPLIAVVESIVSVCVAIYSGQSVVISALLE